MTDDREVEIICDANVLIHYYMTDKRILKLVSQYIGKVHVPGPILDEVDQIDIEEAGRLGLTVFEPEDAYIIQAGNQGGPLSKHDKLLMLLAKDKGYICWTSDSCLKRHCDENGISTCWGLEMMLRLCRRRHLEKSAAIQIARAIQTLDRGFITSAVIYGFERKLKDL